MLGLVIVSIFGIVAILAPLIPLQDPSMVDLHNSLVGPGKEHPLGTDQLGRDTLSRLLLGIRTTLGTASLVLLVVTLVALAVGMTSGFYGARIDIALMAIVDLLLAFPGLILAIAIAGVLGPSLMNVMIAVTIVWWAGYARLVRGMTLSIREKEFIESAKAIGASDLRIIRVHVLRNIIGPVVVLATLDIGWIILGISGLNFLGLGAQPPTPELGAMLNDGRPYMQSAPQLMLYPCIAIFLLVLGFNLLGDGLRDLLDPRT